MAHYLFNLVTQDAAEVSSLRDRAAGLLGARMWGVDADEPHRDALAPGDLVLIYLGAPERVFVGRAELASAVHGWTPAEASQYPGESTSGVLLTGIEAWALPVPMSTVLSQMDPSENARAEFPMGVVGITANEYDTTLAVAMGV